MKTIQCFSNEYLETCKDFSVEEIVDFIENFRQLYFSRDKTPTKLISIKIEEDLLNLFKKRANLENKKYQTKIKELMKDFCLVTDR